MKKYISILIFLYFVSYTGFAGDKIKIYNSFNEISEILKPKGDTTLFINFWASWCKPCVEELPAIEKVRNEYSNKKIKFLLVCLDDPSKIENMVLPLLKRLDIKAHVVLLDDTDYNSWIDKIDPSWSGAIPGSLIINQNGKKFYEKSFTYAELKQVINNHLIP